MRKLFLFVLITCSFMVNAQVKSDTEMGTYNNTYIKSGIPGGITATSHNTFNRYVLASKIHRDSLDNVRILSETEIEITYKGTVDTVEFTPGGYWTLLEDTLGTQYSVYIDSSFLMTYNDWKFGYLPGVQSVYYDKNGGLYMGVDEDSVETSIKIEHGSEDEFFDSYLTIMCGKDSSDGLLPIDYALITMHSNSSAENQIYLKSVLGGNDTSYIFIDPLHITLFANSTTINGQIFVPDIAASGAKYSGNVAGIGTDDRLFPKSIIDLFHEQQDSLKTLGKAIYQQENVLTVGDSSEIYSDFSTAVAAASAGQVIELSSATFTESGTVTMPTGSTLKIYEGGLLSGTFTLVGNNTRFDAGIYQCFGSDVTITGTWIVDKTYVDWFGMIGAANEGGELNKAISFCKLTTGKNLVFQNKHYYVENFQTLWEGGGTIEGNGATFHHTYTGPNYEEFIDIYGTVGTYDTLTTNAVYGSYILDVPSGSALLGLNRGDMVKIMSDGEADLAGQFVGEIKIVDTVVAAGRNVIFTEPLYNTYYASENARMAKVTPGQAILKDFKVIGNTGRVWNLGVVLKYIKEPLIQNVETNNFQYTGFGIYNCYAGRFDVVAQNALDNTGQGYGFMLTGANMNNIITIRGFKLRHIVAFGGNGSGGGVAYNNILVNCIGTGVYAHAYDMHEATGSGNRYINCKATGGVFVSDTANFQGEWSSLVTYDNNDIVAISRSTSQYQQLYKSKTNGNLNNSPVTDLGTNWEVYNNKIYGFNILCGDASIENCEVSGFTVGLLLSLYDRRNIKVDGLKAINCRYAIDINADTLSNSSFNNIQLQNETYKSDAFVIYLINSTLNKVSFTNISGKGAFGFYLDGCTFTDKKLEINSVVGDGLLMVGTQTSEVHFNVGTAYLTQKTNPGYIINSGTENGLKTINVDNMTVQNAAARPVVIANHLNSLTFGNVYLIDGTTTVFIDNNDSIDRCSIGYLYNGGSGDLEILDNTSTYTGSQYVGNSGGTINMTPSLKGTVIANQTHFQNATAYRLDIAETVSGLYHGYISMNGVRWAHGHRSGTYLGRSSGNSDIDNFQNIGIGDNTLTAATDADDNVCIGYYAGDAITEGDQNVIIGSNAGGTKTTGSGNVIIGYNAANAAGFATTSNQLIIDNSNSTTPLIYGDFSTDAITINGSCSITTFIKLTPTADPPGSPSAGMIYSDTDGHVYHYDGSNWDQLDN